MRIPTVGLAFSLATLILSTSVEAGYRSVAHVSLSDLQHPATLAALSDTPTKATARRKSKARSARLNRVDWLSMDLHPATLSPQYKGRIEMRRFTVVGDLASIDWQASPSAPIRRFERLEVIRRDGLTLSIFDISFPASDLRHLPPFPIRFDCRTPPACPESGWPFRVRPSTIRKAQVVRINDHVQYSSHVVNIVAPYDSLNPSLPTGDRYFWPPDVARVFYQHFSDSYEELAFLPSRVHRTPQSGAGSFMVYNDVTGTGIDSHDGRGFWGGSEVLQSAIAFFRGGLLGNWLSLHETGHHWGFRFDLFGVAGEQVQGSNKCMSAGHTPLIADRVSFMSHCLNLNDPDHPNLIIRRSDNGFVLANSEPPLFYHPLQLYAMGLVPSTDVPPVWLRLRQDRPRPFKPGTRVKGEFVEVTIEQVVAMYGERRGPRVPSAWRRAYIVVSPERLLSAKDLAWFNFFAKRISDPDVTGNEGLDRTPSMEVATLGKVDLRTEIRPANGRPIAGNFPVSYPKVGRGDLVGLKLDKKVTTRYKAGGTYVISGRVLQPEHHRVLRIELGSQTFNGSLDPSGQFTVRIKPSALDRGPNWLIFTLGDIAKVVGRVAPVWIE